jgi:hypothetical protein
MNENYSRNYNTYDNPSSNMRVNTKLLKHIMIVTDWVMKNETPVSIKASAKEVFDRTNRYCESHYQKVYSEVNYIKNNTIERFQNESEN